MASIGNITAKGRSGRQYQFELYGLDTTFKQVGGVYVFLRGSDPVYVGHTGDLSERFDGHHKAAAIRAKGADRIGVLVEGSEQRRLAIESDLLGGYQWPCNG